MNLPFASAIMILSNAQTDEPSTVFQDLSVTALREYTQCVSDTALKKDDDKLSAKDVVEAASESCESYRTRVIDTAVTSRLYSAAAGEFQGANERIAFAKAQMKTARQIISMRVDYCRKSECPF